MILVHEIQYHTLGHGPGEVGFGAFHLVRAEADSDTQVSSIIDSHLNIPPKKSTVPHLIFQYPNPTESDNDSQNVNFVVSDNIISNIFIFVRVL